jgi:hypothetical protein
MERPEADIGGKLSRVQAEAVLEHERDIRAPSPPSVWVSVPPERAQRHVYLWHPVFYLSAEIFIDFKFSSSKPTVMYLDYKEKVQNAIIYFFYPLSTNNLHFL